MNAIIYKTSEKETDTAVKHRVFNILSGGFVTPLNNSSVNNIL